MVDRHRPTAGPVQIFPRVSPKECLRPLSLTAGSVCDTRPASLTGGQGSPGAGEAGNPCVATAI